MPVPLMKFPLLVLVEIFNNMQYSTLFDISICSIRARQMIEFARIGPMKVRYMVKRKSLTVQVSRRNALFETVTVLKKVSLQNLPLSKSSRVTIGDNYEIWTRSQLERTRWSQKTHFRYKVLDLGEHIQNAVQKHICFLFRHSQSAEIVNVTYCKDPAILNSTDSLILSRERDLIVLEEYLSKMPEQRSVNIKPEIFGSPNEISLLFNIPNIQINFFDRLLENTFLRRFTGRNLIIQESQFNADEVVDFVEDWVYGRAYHDLESLQIDSSAEAGLMDDFIIWQCQRGRIVKHLQMTRPVAFEYDPKITGVNCQKFGLEDEGCVELRRKIDNKKAFMRVWLDTFWFVVPSSQ